MSAALSPERSLGYQINHLARLLEHALRDRIKDFGVVPGQFAQLLALYDSNGLTQAQLCERVQIEQPTMARTLSRMERDGLITRTPNPADARSALVTLTPHACELQAALTEAAQAVNAHATAGLGTDDINRLMQLLATVIANLQSDKAPPSKDDNVHSSGVDPTPRIEG